EKASRLNIHTYRVLEKISALRAALNESESRLRGFALTGDIDTLEDARNAGKEAKEALVNLQDLTRDRPDQQTRLRDFSTDYSAWHRKYAQIDIPSLVVTRRIAAETRPRRGAMSGLRNQIDAIENTERALLVERGWQQENSQRSAAKFLLYASICAVTFTGAFIVLLGFQMHAADKANRSLSDSQNQLETVLEVAPIILYAVDHNETFTLMTGKGAPSIGLNSETVVGKKIDQVLGDAYDFEPLRAALEGRANVSRSQIRDIVFETNRIPIFDASGGVTGMIGVGLDVTDRVQAEDALRLSEARFRSVIESVQEVVFQIDGEGCWSFLNPAWRILLGHEVESSLGKPAIDFA
ncbi:PAS domain S-box protein, partial [bacterium]